MRIILLFLVFSISIFALDDEEICLIVEDDETTTQENDSNVFYLFELPQEIIFKIIGNIKTQKDISNLTESCNYFADFFQNHRKQLLTVCKQKSFNEYKTLLQNIDEIFSCNDILKSLKKAYVCEIRDSQFFNDEQREEIARLITNFLTKVNYYQFAPSIWLFGKQNLKYLSQRYNIALESIGATEGIKFACEHDGFKEMISCGSLLIGGMFFIFIQIFFKN